MVTKREHFQVIYQTLLKAQDHEHHNKNTSVLLEFVKQEIELLERKNSFEEKDSNTNQWK